MTAAAPQTINARAILATLDRRYDLGDDGDASPCNSAVPYVLEFILVCAYGRVYMALSDVCSAYPGAKASRLGLSVPEDQLVWDL